MDYLKRRQTLSKRFSRTLFVIPAGGQAKRSHSVGYRFKSASDFLYLTGTETQDAILVICGSKQYLLSKQETSVWDDDSQVKADNSLELHSLSKLEEIVQSHLNDCDRLAFPVGRVTKVDEAMLNCIAYERRHRGRKSSIPLGICDSRTLVGALRLVKDQDEIHLMKEAAKRSSKVHTDLMKQNFIGRSERDIANWIEARFMEEGMQWTAYETIVGSGNRSTLLHARATDQIIQEKDILVIDAGGEYKGYCADITRALPAGKKFSTEQKVIYGAVLTSQKAVIAAVKPGETLVNLHALAQRVLLEELSRLGLSEKIETLMPHSTSHWIGMDVHDPASYYDDSGDPLKLEKGMVFTVEPGLYVREEHQLPKEYKGIGVRIEDDILVTEKGCESLTSVPKEIVDVEALR